jgi:hypothetical protein
LTRAVEKTWFVEIPSKIKTIMQYTIRKSKHRAWPFRLGLYFNKKKLRFRVCFDQSCKHSLGDEDQLDINKLFGIGYFPNHHKESARFGWRYNADTNKIELFAYCYVLGERVTQFITSIALNISVVLELSIDLYAYTFTVIKDSIVANSSVPHFRKPNKLAFALGVFFGGDKPAPHKMKIDLKKL